MGWFYDKPELPACYDHEGYVVALTYRTLDGRRCTELFTELHYPDKGTYEPEAIARIQAGCNCGWRSPYLVPERGIFRGETSVHRLPRYTPCSAWVTEADEDRCEALWDEHVHQAVPGMSLQPVRQRVAGRAPGTDGGEPDPRGGASELYVHAQTVGQDAAATHSTFPRKSERG